MSQRPTLSGVGLSLGDHTIFFQIENDGLHKVFEYQKPSAQPWILRTETCFTWVVHGHWVAFHRVLVPQKFLRGVITSQISAQACLKPEGDDRRIARKAYLEFFGLKLTEVRKNPTYTAERTPR